LKTSACQHSTVSLNFCKFSIGRDYLNGKGLPVTGSAEMKGRSLTQLRLDFFETKLTDDGLSLLAVYRLLNRPLARFAANQLLPDGTSRDRECYPLSFA
jgi:hypothetical protein